MSRMKERRAGMLLLVTLVEGSSGFEVQMDGSGIQHVNSKCDTESIKAIMSDRNAVF